MPGPWARPGRAPPIARTQPSQLWEAHSTDIQSRISQTIRRIQKIIEIQKIKVQALGETRHREHLPWEELNRLISAEVSQQRYSIRLEIRNSNCVNSIMSLNLLHKHRFPLSSTSLIMIKMEIGFHFHKIQKKAWIGEGRLKKTFLTPLNALFRC